MKTYHIILFLLIMCIITACNRPRIVVDSGREGFDEVKVFCGDTICHIIWRGQTAIVDPAGEPLEGRFFHYHENDSIITKYICCKKSTGGTIIKGHIDDYSYDNDFLIVNQKPIDSILGEYLYYNNDGIPLLYPRRKYDTCKTYTETKIMLDLSRIHQYWIINKISADVYGPLSYDDYLNIKKQLGVPPDLMLKREKYDIYNNK